MRYLLALLAVVHLSGFATQRNARGRSRGFYRWVISYQGAGLPSPEQRKQLTRMLTADFVQLLAAASETESRCVAGLPRNMKGDIWEGNLFVNNYEGGYRSLVWRVAH
jgi:hypothetical protein